MGSLSGCSSSGTPAASSPAAHLTVRGSVDAPPLGLFADETSPTEGAECTTDEGYDDIARGAEVVVSSSSGKALAFGELGPGAVHNPDGGAPVDATCRFAFAVSAVPGGRGSYRLHVGDENRGSRQYTATELTRDVVLTIQ